MSAFRYSYSDFTVKGHGVIEGYFSSSNPTGRRNRKFVPAYSIVKSIPAYYDKVAAVEDIDPYLSAAIQRNNLLRIQIKHSLRSGEIIRVGAFVIRKNKGNLFEIFHRVPRHNTPITPRKRSASKRTIKRRIANNSDVDEIYKHLKAIHKRAQKR